jgi:formylglycine-generating enzyme
MNETNLRSTALLAWPAFACVVLGCSASLSPSAGSDAGSEGADAATSADAMPAPNDAGWSPDAGAADATAALDAAPTPDAAVPTDALPPLDVVVPNVPPTTAALTGPGLDDCGPARNASCASTIRLPGGTYNVRGDGLAPATVSPYRLDTYKVTTGRFRKFTEAWLAGWRPAEGAGKHLHVHGGRGLARKDGGYEAGWSTAWNGWVGAASRASVPVASLDAATWTSHLKCGGAGANPEASWTTTPAGREAWPMNCANWFESYAFCIWDGGFLPSEIEWDYAAIGGTEGRRFPWGAEDVDPTRALYASTQLEPVGSKPAGNGRWGHAELLGGLQEFVYDVVVTQFAANCTDCAHDGTYFERTVRGTYFKVSATTVAFVSSVGRSGSNMDLRNAYRGLRCARP